VPEEYENVGKKTKSFLIDNYQIHVDVDGRGHLLYAGPGSFGCIYFSLILKATCLALFLNEDRYLRLFKKRDFLF
jgi:hypothetical protein